MQDLERRLELCASFHLDTESKLDCSRSRLKVERNGLNIERYEDLMGHNFREIEWTSISRVKMDPESKERTASIDRV